MNPEETFYLVNEETVDLVPEESASNMIIVFLAVTVCLLDLAANVVILYYIFSKDWPFVFSYLHFLFPCLIKIVCIVYTITILKEEFSPKRNVNIDDDEDCEGRIVFGGLIVFGIGLDVFVMFYYNNVFTIINGVFSSVSGLLLLAIYCINKKVEK